MTIVDLALHAASICNMCRAHGRPSDESDNEHGDLFYHRFDNKATAPRCMAEQIWGLIRKLERVSKGIYQ